MLSSKSFLLLLACLLSGACAGSLRRLAPSATPTPVRVVSNNLNDVEVYLLCGDRDASLLGAVPAGDGAELVIPPARLLCARGLNFFLVDRGINHGYWVGPFHPGIGERIDLVIERYAGLSTARLSSVWR